MKTSSNTSPPPETAAEVLLSRRQICARWNCCAMTVRRRESAGLLAPVRFNSRLLRYRLRDVLALEQAAATAQPA